jgi:hypothetical protein
MAIKVQILHQGSGMFGKAGSEHVRQYPRHDCGSKHVIKPIEALLDEMGIYVEEEIVDILYSRFEIFEPKLVRQLGGLIESARHDLITSYCHGWLA